MIIKEIIDNIRKFIDTHSDQSIVYARDSDPSKFFKKCGIKVELDKYKDIILQDETKLELGGSNKKSFSLIYPLHINEVIQDGKITIIGPEIKNSLEQGINFGMFILIGFEKINEKMFDSLRRFSFISNGIEGFMIRTIPRRFWCRISEKIVKKFTFEFFANAIMYLYEQEFKDLIKSMEIIIISSKAEIMEEFIEITSDLSDHLSSKWKEKIEEWKKRIDCDYDWDCNECPYVETCEEVKEVLEERRNIEN